MFCERGELRGCDPTDGVAQCVIGAKDCVEGLGPPDEAIICVGWLWPGGGGGWKRARELSLIHGVSFSGSLDGAGRFVARSVAGVEKVGKGTVFWQTS